MQPEMHTLQLCRPPVIRASIPEPIRLVHLRAGCLHHRHGVGAHPTHFTGVTTYSNIPITIVCPNGAIRQEHFSVL